MKWPVIVYFLILSLGVFTFLIKFKKHKPGVKYIFYHLLGVIFTESLGFSLLYAGKVNYYWPYHIYAPLGYALFAAAFMYELNDKRLKKFVKVSVFLYFLISVVFSVSVKYNGATSTITTIQNILMILVVVAYFKDSLSRTDSVLSVRDPFTWFAVAYLIYCTGTFFTMALLGYLKHNYPALVKKYFSINYALSYMLYIFYSIGFLCSKDKKQSVMS